MKYYCKATNVVANDIYYRLIETNNKDEALEQFEASIERVLKEHPSARYEDIEVHRITKDLEHFVYVKSNGYALESKFYDFIHEVQNKAIEIFGNELLMFRHFYYGERLDMFDIVLKDGNYCNYEVYSNGVVHAGGHSYTSEQHSKFKALEVE